MSVTEKSQKSPAKRSWKEPACLTILLVGFTAIFLWMWHLRPRVPLLLTVATQAVPKGQFLGPDFAWLSNDEYLYVGLDNLTLFRYRLSGKVSTQLLKVTGDRSWSCALQASPDGKWLLWVKRTGHGKYHDLVSQEDYLTSLKDGHTHSLDVFEGHWEPDSRHIIGRYFSGNGSEEPKVGIYDTRVHRVIQTVSISPKVSSSLYDLIPIPPKRLLECSQTDTLENTPLDISEYGGDKTLNLIREWPVKPPHNTTIEETRISPQGNRIAWLVESAYVDAGRAALHRWLPFFKAPSQPREELWISQLDGAGMRIVGQIPIRVRSGNEVRITDLRWLPDGKHLSFSYEDALWTVSAQR